MGIKLHLVFLATSLWLVMIISSGVLLGQSQLQWQRYIQIEVSADGSSAWMVQQRATLTTAEDEAAFFEYINITSLDAISGNVHAMIDQASLTTGRIMRMENLEVTANVTTKGLSEEGILQYEFDWVGFAEKANDENITLGDALSGETDLLSRDDALTVKYPSGYVPVFVDPVADESQQSERTLTWFGPRNFGSGEPRVLFRKSSPSWTDAITNNVALLSTLMAATFTGFIGYFVGLRRARLNRRLEPGGIQEHVFSSELGVEGDEEKVIRLLVGARGQMQQLAITRQCGFSKSKGSEVLSSMERKGLIVRKKLGRGKIVTLVENPENLKG